MAVALGLDPRSLLELDASMFDALERAAGARWTAANELAALQLEVAHGHFLAFLAAHSPPNRRLPKPMRVTRPTDEGYPATPVLSAAAFAVEYGPTTGCADAR